MRLLASTARLSLLFGIVALVYALHEQQDENRLFRESYSPEVPEEALTTTTLALPVDIYEDEHNIILKIEVPGIDEKDIDVRIQNNTLTVRGERKDRERKRKRRTSVASSGNTGPLPGHSRFPAPWIRASERPL
jgi:HSP20 family molecular chaperone IbpA